MKLALAPALPHEIPAIVALRNEVARDLTNRFGPGHWSYEATEKGVSGLMNAKSQVYVAKAESRIVGTLRLATKRPWAIDPDYFTPVTQPLYLLDMAVLPSLQGKGIGRFMLAAIGPVASRWPAHAIRLDAYDHDAGAGEFYRKCGYTEKGRVAFRNNPLIYFEYLL